MADSAEAGPSSSGVAVDSHALFPPDLVAGFAPKDNNLDQKLAHGG